MGNSISDNCNFVYLNYLNGPSHDKGKLRDSIGKLPRIKLELPKISISLSDVELLI